MQSKAARYILQKSRRDWSKMEGFAELKWYTIPQIAVEASLKMFFRVLWLKRPERLFQSIFSEKEGAVKKYEETELEKIPKLSRKSWRVRVLRYSRILPRILFELDPKS